MIEKRFGSEKKKKKILVSQVLSFRLTQQTS